MRRRFQGLHQADKSAAGDLPDGTYLVRVQRCQYRWHAQKPYYVIRFVVICPNIFEGKTFSSRVYCSAKALWKFSWFLRDFGYDSELLSQDEVEDKNLIGLNGVVKISHTVLKGITLLNLDAVAPAAQWEEASGHHSHARLSEVTR
jgi:hypothetical protein